MTHVCGYELTLRAKGLRRTGGRHRLLRLFDEERAWTATELRSRLGRIDLSTIYRNLHELLKKDVISEAGVAGTETRYELAGRSHHAHLLCPRCSRTECVPCPVNLAAQHQLSLTGLCSACNKKRP
ncbi:MAG: transcriptional repressor [Patescibacteria group bacterium]|jgi:Fe2+ or Zn2+ uptake regulation protein